MLVSSPPPTRPPPFCAPAEQHSALMQAQTNHDHRRCRSSLSSFSVVFIVVSVVVVIVLAGVVVVRGVVSVVVSVVVVIVAIVIVNVIVVVAVVRPKICFLCDRCSSSCSI